MDLFKKVINVLSSTKADNARQSRGSPSNLQGKTIHYFTSDTVPPSKTMNAVHPQDKSASIMMNGHGFEGTVPPTQAMNLMHLQGKSVPYVVMNGHGFEGTVPPSHAIEAMHPQGKSDPYVVMNDHGSDDAVPPTEAMKTVHLQDKSISSVSMNGKWVEGPVPPSQDMNPVHPQSKYVHSDMINGHGFEDIVPPIGAMNAVHTQGKSVSSGKMNTLGSCTTSVNYGSVNDDPGDDEKILNDIPAGLLTEGDKQHLRDIARKTREAFCIGRSFTDTNEVRKVLSEFGSRADIGFTVRKEGANSLVCSRAANSHSRRSNGCATKAGKKLSSMSTNCPFVIRIKKCPKKG